MLTPETLDALDQAITAVVHEAGDDPQYTDLVHALTDAQHALPDSGGAKSANEPPRDSVDDPHSFTAAKAKLAERRSAA